MIGSDPASRQAVARILTELGSIDVESLDLSRRSIELAGSRHFGWIVVDVHAGDPIALLGGLARRLAGVSRRGVPIIVAHGPEDGAFPAIESLVRETRAGRLARPVDPAQLLAMLTASSAASSTAALVDVAS